MTGGTWQQDPKSSAAARAEAATLARVRYAAWAALVAGTAGAVYGGLRLRHGSTSGLLVTGVVELAAVAAALGVLRHGARYLHERGRRVAAIALAVSLAGGLLLAVEMAWRVRRGA